MTTPPNPLPAIPIQTSTLPVASLPDPSPLPALTNGPAAAAILAAATGCFTLGLLQLLADLSKPLGKFLNFLPASGSLTGETTLAILAWLLLWFLLDRLWRTRTVPLGRINLLAFTLLALGALLTFPPFDNLF